MTRINTHAEIVSCSACPVRRLSLFSPFSDEELRTVASLRSGMRHFGEGEDIVWPEDEHPELFTVFSGWAKRYRLLEDGSQHIARFYLPGDFIDVSMTLTDDHRHGVVSLTPVTVCVFRRTRMLTGLQDQSRLSMALTWLSAREAAMGEEALLAARHLNSLQRIGQLLLELFERMRLRNAVTDNACRFPLRQQDIADHLGLSPEHVNRVLGDLKRRNLARIEQRRLIIPDIDALADVAGWDRDYLSPQPLF